MFEGSRHETLHDKDQERVRELIKDWVLAHLTDPEPAVEHVSQSPPSTESKPTGGSAETASGPDQTTEGQLGTEQATMPQEPESSDTSQTVQSANTWMITPEKPLVLYIAWLL